MNGIATVSAVFLLFCAQQADAYSFATGGQQAVQVNMRQRSGLAVGNVYCVRARYYSADLKRFATVDPIGIQGGLNLYVYGSDNPLAFLDPLGLCDGPSWGQGSANNSRYGPILKSSDDPDYDPDALAANNMFSGLGAANLSNGDMARDLTITAITTVAGEAVLGPAVSAVRKFLGYDRAFWIGTADGEVAAYASGRNVLRLSKAAQAAYDAGDVSLMQAESAAWAKDAKGVADVYVGTTGAGNTFWEYELPELINNVNKGTVTINYHFVPRPWTQ